MIFLAKLKKKKEKRINKYTVYLGTFVLIVILILVIYYSRFVQINKKIENQEEILLPKTELTIEKGFCKKNSECFITYCKGSEKDCVNTTQLSIYSKNCKTYSDWVVEKQDFSRCSCIRNFCTMIK